MRKLPPFAALRLRARRAHAIEEEQCRRHERHRREGHRDPRVPPLVGAARGSFIAPAVGQSHRRARCAPRRAPRPWSCRRARCHARPTTRPRRPRAARAHAPRSRVVGRRRRGHRGDGPRALPHEPRHEPARRATVERDEHRRELREQCAARDDLRRAHLERELAHAHGHRLEHRFEGLDGAFEHRGRRWRRRAWGRGSPRRRSTRARPRA